MSAGLAHFMTAGRPVEIGRQWNAPWQRRRTSGGGVGHHGPSGLQ
jgi:hypothetical protein